MIKPVVHFIGDVSFHSYDDEDGTFTSAVVFGIDHPKLPRGIIRTSDVIKKYPDGSFETLNTFYKPVDEIQNPE